MAYRRVAELPLSHLPQGHISEQLGPIADQAVEVVLASCGVQPNAPEAKSREFALRQTVNLAAVRAAGAA